MTTKQIEFHHFSKYSHFISFTRKLKEIDKLVPIVTNHYMIIFKKIALIGFFAWHDYTHVKEARYFYAQLRLDKHI